MVLRRNSDAPQFERAVALLKDKAVSHGANGDSFSDRPAVRFSKLKLNVSRRIVFVCCPLETMIESLANSGEPEKQSQVSFAGCNGTNAPPSNPATEQPSNPATLAQGTNQLAHVLGQCRFKTPSVG